MYTLGIDIGSRNTKIVIWNPTSRQIIWQGYQSTEVSVASAVDKLLNLASAHCATSLISSSCVTGYGRKLYRAANKVLSEISCHAAGCHYLYPDCRTVIDIGGQDSKIISLSSSGAVDDFVMNDKCAAGTGRFLEMTAFRLECSLDELTHFADQSDMDLKLNSTCVVFAESEIIGLLAEGHSSQNIAHAVYMSIAKRIYAQMAGIDVNPAIIFTGGVAKSNHLRRCLEKLLGKSLDVPFEPEISGALGAAILA